MNESILKVKQLRTEVSVVLEQLNQFGTGSPILVECQRYGLEAFSMLGKVLVFLGEPDPFDKGEPTVIPDWTTKKPAKITGIQIRSLKVLRTGIQKIISSSVFNQLLNGFIGVGEPYVKYNQLDWYYTMASMTNLLMMKSKLETYMQTLYFAETKAEKDARHAAEKVGKPAVVIPFTVDASHDEMIKYLKDNNIPVSDSIPSNVLTEVYKHKIYLAAVTAERDVKAKELDAERNLKTKELKDERTLKAEQRFEDNSNTQSEPALRQKQ
jgi:hypothetical protein